MSRKHSERKESLAISKGCKRTLQQFSQLTTLHGYKNVVEPNRHYMERLSWFVLLLATLFVSVYVAMNGWLDFIDNPTYTSLKSVKHPIWKVPFPAVCICSINRISRQEALNYANVLAAKFDHINVSWAFERIRYFGRLSDYNEEDSHEMQLFQEVLDSFDAVDGIYDMQSQIQQLSPNCKDLLLRCQWEGSDIDCSEIFTLRLTMEGYCCAFNYVRPKNTLSFEDLPSPMRNFLTGPENGLVVVLNTSATDYYYPTKNTIGVTVSINSPTEYPDESSGNFNRIILNSRTEAFIKLDVTAVKASPDVETCSIKQRGCLFRHEREIEYGGHYSFNDCLIKCKIRSFIALCGCIPFNLPTNFPDFSLEMRSYLRCNLAHVKCLFRYKTTINTIRPNLDHYSHLQGLEKEMGDSVSCPNCLPLCSQHNYRIQTTYAKFSANLKEQPLGIMKNLTHMRDVSIVRIYYPFLNTNIYTTDILYTWQELIGNFGGMLGLCIGLSIIGAIEVIYFATIKLVQNIFCSNELYNVNALNEDLFSSKNLEKHILEQQWALPKRQIRPQYF